MGKNAKEGNTSGKLQTMEENACRDPTQQPATVHFLDSTKHIFYVPVVAMNKYFHAINYYYLLLAFTPLCSTGGKDLRIHFFQLIEHFFCGAVQKQLLFMKVFSVQKRAEGSELFDKVAEFLNLTEKDYFALSFTDCDGDQHWIYEDKRISKQLRGHPWDFNFGVKFYPPEPATLADDNTRHLLSLQIRKDIYTGKLPATVATHALLGSYVAQSEQGDYEPSLQYVDFLKSCRLAPLSNDTLYEKIEELHKQHKGVTSSEADFKYLEIAKKLSMYGVHFFPAKDGKGVSVQVGVCAHGIHIYRDQIRVHRFLWQNIIKIGYRHNIFIVKVKPGELEKNVSTAAFKFSDHEAVKQAWKCGVEHHTFFRLIQPEEKPHKGLLRWGSARFRYQGRTQFQSKMASQMFSSNQPIQRSQSARMTRSDESGNCLGFFDNIFVVLLASLSFIEVGAHSVPEKKLNFMKHVGSPREIYTTSFPGTDQRKGYKTMMNDEEVGYSRKIQTGEDLRKLHDGICSSSVVTSVITTTTVPISTNTITVINSVIDTHQFHDKKTVQTSSYHVSTHSHDICRGIAFSTNHLFDDGLHSQTHYGLDGISRSGPNISVLRKQEDMQFVPVEDTAVVYHPGHYEEQVAGNRTGLFLEPPVEQDDDFVLVHKPKLGVLGKIFHQSGSETDILVKEEDIEARPIRYSSNVYQPGFYRFARENKDFEVLEHGKCSDSQHVGKLKVDEEKHFKDEESTGHVSHVEKDSELSLKPLRSHEYVDSTNEKNKWPHSLPCYQQLEKSEEHYLKGNTEVGKSMIPQWTESRTRSKLHGAIKPEKEAKKIAFVHVKSGVYEEQPESRDAYELEKSAAVTELDKGVKRTTVVQVKTPIWERELAPRDSYTLGKAESVSESGKGTTAVHGNSESQSIWTGNYKSEAVELIPATEKETKKMANIHVNTPIYERQLEHTTEYEPKVSGVKKQTCVSKENSGREDRFDAPVKEIGATVPYKTSLHPKQACRLFMRAPSSPINPEAYGVPSTSYDGPLHSIKYDSGFVSLPIHEHVTIYHSGVSVDSDRNRDKLSRRKQYEKETSDKSSSNEQQDFPDSGKMTAVIVVSQSDSAVTSQAYEEKSGEKALGIDYSHQLKTGLSADFEMSKEKLYGTSHEEKNMKPFGTQGVKGENAVKNTKAILSFGKPYQKIEDDEKMRTPSATNSQESKLDYKVRRESGSSVLKDEISTSEDSKNNQPKDALTYDMLAVIKKEDNESEKLTSSLFSKQTNLAKLTASEPDQETSHTGKCKLDNVVVDTHVKTGDKVLPGYATTQVSNTSSPEMNDAESSRAPLFTYSVLGVMNSAKKEIKKMSLRKESALGPEELPEHMESNVSSETKVKDVLPVTMSTGSMPDDRLGTDGADKGTSIARETQDIMNVKPEPVSRYSVLAVVKPREMITKMSPKASTSPPEKLSQESEISFQPIHFTVKHETPQAKHLSLAYKKFKRVKHKGTVEFIAKENLDPQNYNFENTPYQGPLEVISFTEGLQFAPIHEYCTISHPAKSRVRLRKLYRQKRAPKITKVKRPLIRNVKKTAILHLNKDADRGESRDQSSSPLYELESNLEHKSSSSPEQSTAYKARVVCNKFHKKEHDSEPKKQELSFKHCLISGDAEIVEKIPVKPETYHLITMPYDGPVSRLELSDELSYTALQELVAVYHSGISYKETQRLYRRDSKSSVGSKSTSSGSSTINSRTSKSGSLTSGLSNEHKRMKKKMKAKLFLSPNERNRTGLSKGKGFFSFWRKGHDDEGTRAVRKKQKLKTSSKLQFGEQQRSPSFDSTAGHEPSVVSQDISTTAMKGSVSGSQKTVQTKENESKNTAVKLYIKNESLTISGNVEESGKHSKFSPFSFWRLSEREGKKNLKKSDFISSHKDRESEPHSQGLHSSYREADDVSSARESKKKALVYITAKGKSYESDSSDLFRSKDSSKRIAKAQESLFEDETIIEPASSSLPDSSLVSERETTHLRACTSSVVDRRKDVVSTSPETEVAYQPLRTKVSIQYDELYNVEGQKTKLHEEKDACEVLGGSADDNESSADMIEESDGKRYMAKVKVKSEESYKGKGDEQPTLVAARKEKELLGDSLTKKSSFVVKGFHLRGPNSEFEETNAIARGVSKQGVIKSIHTCTSAGLLEKDVGEVNTSEDGNEKLDVGKKIPTLRIRNEKLVESDTDSKESKKAAGKTGFFSIWRGSKRSRQQKAQNKSASSGTNDSVQLTLSSDPNTLPPGQKEVLLNANDEQCMFPVESAEVRMPAKHSYVPVYDFSYVPNFGTNIEIDSQVKQAESSEKKLVASMTVKCSGDVRQDCLETDAMNNTSTEEKERGANRFKQLFGRQVKHAERFLDTSFTQQDVSTDEKPPITDDHKQLLSRDKAFLSELTWEKSGGKSHGHLKEPITSQAKELQLATGAEIPDEPYKFTQTPPNDLDSVAHSSDLKDSRGIMQQIKRQVAQVCAVVLSLCTTCFNAFTCNELVCF
ncbi:unnamed protein product [Thelazia callipaeda]|uniref:Moesin/ezrin/radixin homolog 1 n=1 Tax=Thelazia callipaeda TaxID=103827 RepID=A0A0N5D227_THECL|nr:unnamed protein product [Thelazia callipaeda]